MTEPIRIRMGSEREIRLPRFLVEKLGWKTGSTLEITADGDSVRLHRVEVDPFAEALKKPDEGAFDKIFEEQQRSREAAFRAFDEKMLPKDDGRAGEEEAEKELEG